MITEKLPSLNRQAKENAKVHNRIQRDEDQEQLKRMEQAFMGDEIQRAKGPVKSYALIIYWVSHSRPSFKVHRGGYIL